MQSVKDANGYKIQEYLCHVVLNYTTSVNFSLKAILPIEMELNARVGAKHDSY